MNVPIVGFAPAATNSFIAATSFVLADGTKLEGYCSPDDDSGMDYIQPVLFASGRQVALFPNGDVDSSVIIELAELLAKPERHIFPIRWECLVRVDRRLVGGEITSDDIRGVTV